MGIQGKVARRRFLASLMSMALIGIAIGCESPSDALHLPAGSPDLGLVAFQELGCTSCHVVAGKSIERTSVNPVTYVVLGGQKTKVTGYAELVTSVINPNHRLSRGGDPRASTPDALSLMKPYNEVMSVQQLIDIVEFLKPAYQVWPSRASGRANSN